MGESEAFLISFSDRADADGNMWPLLHTGGNGNYELYNNPIVDQLLDEAPGSSDVGRRREIHARLWLEERKDLPIIYLRTFKDIVGVNHMVTGFGPVPDGLIWLNGVSLAN